MIAGSNLEQVLVSGQFAVTGELGPPKSGDPEVVREKARVLKGHVDAANITDCQTAIVRMSSQTAALLALAEGVEPVMQMTCRDRNRIGIQADILGASALGIKNLLCLTGDHQKFGNHPQAKGVFDMDSIQLLGMLRGMRDERRFQCGEEIKGHEPRLFLGAAANPFADPFEYRPVRLAKKAAAGASFVQTQIIYNVAKFARFMEMVRALGLDSRVFILAGVTPPKSLGMARYMKRFVPGLDVTDDVIKRMADAKDPREEGIEICVDIIRQVREIPGVAGVHVMAIEWEQAVPEIVKRAGLLPRPVAKGVEPVLMASGAVEDALARAREEAGIALAVDLEKARLEARASMELVARAKESAAAEIAHLKRGLDAAESRARKGEAEVKRLGSELAQARARLVQPPAPGGIRRKFGVSQAVSTPATTGGTVMGGASGPREERALESLSLGLKSLRKALGLDEDQFEALRRFLEAEFILYSRETEAAEAYAPREEEAVSASDETRHRQVVRLVAKGNVLLQRQDSSGAAKVFREALALDASDEKAAAGLARAEAALAKGRAAPREAPPSIEGLPPCPPELTGDEWRRKWVIRLVARGNVLLDRADAKGAMGAFEEALALEPSDQKALAGLALARSGKLETGAEGGAPMPGAREVEPRPEPAPTPRPRKEEGISPPRPVVSQAPAKAPEAAPSAPEGVKPQVPDLPKEARQLSERVGSIPSDTYLEPSSGVIREVLLGEGDKAVSVGGASCLPYHLFEGKMPRAPICAWEVMDAQPEEWPEVLTRHYSGVLADPVSWARRCVDEYGAQVICLSLTSTDPNGLNRSSRDAAKVAQSVLDAVSVPVILWGCGNAEKDTETLREVTNLTGGRRVCLGPLSDANFRALGATAMAFNLPVVASTPIDVNLAKQLNILLENLGVSLDHVVMDPSIGALGYGLEYTYSVMERIRLAALTQQDDKLQAPFVCHLGREVWKAKECRVPSGEHLGDQERRGVLMEAMTGVILTLAGGEILIMRHPKAIALTQAVIRGMM